MVQPNEQLENAKGVLFTLHNSLHRARRIVDSDDGAYLGEATPLLAKVTRAILALAQYLTDQRYSTADAAAVARQLERFMLDDYCLDNLTIHLPDGGYSRLHLDGDQPQDVKIWVDQQLSSPKVKERWRQLVQAAVLR